MMSMEFNTKLYTTVNTDNRLESFTISNWLKLLNQENGQDIAVIKNCANISFSDAVLICRILRKALHGTLRMIETETESRDGNLTQGFIHCNENLFGLRKQWQLACNSFPRFLELIGIIDIYKEESDMQELDLLIENEFNNIVMEHKTLAKE